MNIRQTTPGMRRMLQAASVLVLLVGVQLFVLTEHTDRFFAWHVKPSITAAFLGACYWSAGALEFLSSREERWDRARVAVPGVLVFTALTNLPTAIGLPYYQLNGPAAWTWIAVYLVVPWVLGFLLFRQLRTPGEDGPVERPIPLWLRGVLITEALFFWALMFGLLVGGAAIWPWRTGDALYIAVWLCGLAVVATQASLQQCLTQVRAMLASGVLLGLLHGVVMLRYPGELDWSGPGAWVYAGASGLLLVTSSVGCWMGYRA